MANFRPLLAVTELQRDSDPDRTTVEIQARTEYAQFQNISKKGSKLGENAGQAGHRNKGAQCVSFVIVPALPDLRFCPEIPKTGEICFFLYN